MRRSILAALAEAFRSRCAGWAAYQPLEIAGRRFDGWVARPGSRPEILPYDEWSSGLRLDAIDWTGRTALDVGTNTGSIALEIARRGAARVVGVDRRPELVEVARHWAALAAADPEAPFAGEVEFFAGDADRLEGASSDVVLALSVLHHLHRPREALRRMAALARCALLLEVQMPVDDVPHVRLDELPDEIADPVPAPTYGLGHLPTRECVRRALEDLGFPRVTDLGPGKLPGREWFLATRSTEDSHPRAPRAGPAGAPRPPPR